MKAKDVGGQNRDTKRLFIRKCILQLILLLLVLSIFFFSGATSQLGAEAASLLRFLYHTQTHTHTHAHTHGRTPLNE